MSKYQQYKAYGKKLSVLVDKFGIGILLLLNAQDFKDIANLAVSKWTTAMPKALLVMLSRSSEYDDFIKLNTIVSEFLPKLVQDEVSASDCVAEILGWVNTKPNLSSIPLQLNRNSNLMIKEHSSKRTTKMSIKITTTSY